MANTRFTMQPKQMGLAMSPSYSHTVNGAPPDDDDDGDICPVCDGECTCNTTKLPLRPPTPPAVAAPTPTGPLSMEELSRQYTTATSLSSPSLPPVAAKQPRKPPPPPSYPSLKIKLAIPPTMLAKRHPNSEGSSSSSSHRKSRNPDEMMYVDGSVGENFACIGPSSGAATPTPSTYRRDPPPSIPTTAPRKRGRPRKIVPAARDHSVDSTPRESLSPVHRRTNPKTNIIGRQKQHIYAQKFAKTLKARAPPAPKKLKKKRPVPPKRRRRIDSESSLSDLSDDDDYRMLSRAYDPDSEGDTESVQFPTFVSASALSSMESGGDGSSSDSSSLTDFDSDLSLEQEEEAFLRSEIEDRNKRRESNEWVIRSRRKSAGPSDAEMDSDATEDEDDEEAEEGMQADVEGGGQEEDDGDQTDVVPTRTQDYSLKGLVTGWSDEESDFDADVFFANLSSDSDQTSDDEAKESGGRLGEDDDETSSDVSTEAELLHMREELENLPLELAESWDGQLMFTNGTLGGQAIIDIDFEVNASQFVADSDGCCKNGQCGSPHHDSYMGHDGEDSDVEMSDVDDGGYEEDAGEGEGDTTDEELVGEDDLPNERAMRLFNFPLSVSAINPLSTVSPAVTPASKRPGPRLFTISNRLESPSPADILAGKMGWDSADEMDELFDSEQRGRRRDGSKSEGDSVRLMGPRKGIFTPVQETRQVVIDDSHKEIPSPHPRFNRRRARRFNTVEALLRKHLAAIARHPTSFTSAPSAAPESSPLKLLPSVEIDHASSNSGLLNTADRHQHEETAAAPIELDDVFESSFFNPDPSEASGSQTQLSSTSHGDAPPDSTADESDSNRNEELKHLHRWDIISVGAFRQTRETVGTAAILDSPGAPRWPSADHHHRRTPASSTDYGNVLKASPLSTMLWPSNDKKGKKSRRGGVAAASSLAASPLILPTAGADEGDITPTKNSQTPQQRQLELQQQLHQQPLNNQQQQNYAPKTRKELRKERKSNKKKGYGHSPHGNHHPSHHYHSHHHHPNAKSRSSGSSQRTNFFLSSVPTLNI